MCFKVTGMLGPPVRYKYLLLAIYPSSTGTTRGILQLMSTPGERSEPQASEASPSRAKRGTLRRAKRGSEIVKSIELSAAPRRFTSRGRGGGMAMAMPAERHPGPRRTLYVCLSVQIYYEFGYTCAIC